MAPARPTVLKPSRPAPSRRCLRDDASEHTSDDGEEETLSDMDEPAVQLGLEGRPPILSGMSP